MTKLLYHFNLILALLFPAEDVVVALPLLQALQHCLVIHHYSVKFLVADTFVERVVVVRAGVEHRVRLHVLALSRSKEMAIKLTLWFLIVSCTGTATYRNQLVSVSGKAYQSSVRCLRQRHFVGLRWWILCLYFTLMFGVWIGICNHHFFILSLASGSDWRYFLKRLSSSTFRFETSFIIFWEDYSTLSIFIKVHMLMVQIMCRWTS